MGKRKVIEPIKSTVGSVVNDAFSQIEELKDELQSWLDNMPESKQGSDKASQLEEAIGQLESSSEPEIPESATDLAVSYTEIPSGRRGLSRSKRCSNCVSMVEAASSAVREHISTLDEDKDEEAIMELEAFADELDNATSEWESAEFPGMFG
jgi:vacuolar-type H+-ATPase subunit E/Vma4